MNTLESDVLLASEGDEAAFRRLVEVSANTVCAIALAICRNVQASEDVAQEVFLAAWGNLRQLRNPSSFLPWLRQVTRNQAHLWRRKHAREIGDEDILAAANDGRPSQVDSVLADEERRVLREALEQLPDETREVLVLYYREESSAKQVGLLLGLSEEAVRQRLSRGRALLREQMLSRFASTVARTAPGAVFVSAVAGALTFAAPAASAAVVAASSGKAFSATVVAKATLLGAILGWVGVIMGMHYLEPFFDEQEERELRRFRNILLVVVTLGCGAIALSVDSAAWLLVSTQAVYLVIGYMYVMRLPRILQRRMAWEQSVNPEMAKQNRRQWMRATTSRALAAAIGGAMLMAAAIAFR